jgi:hypothetical protein
MESEIREGFDIDDKQLQYKDTTNKRLSDNSIKLIIQKYNEMQKVLNLNQESITKIQLTIRYYIEKSIDLYKYRSSEYLEKFSDKRYKYIGIVNALIKCLNKDNSKDLRKYKLKYIIARKTLNPKKGREQRNYIRQKLKNIQNTKNNNIKNNINVNNLKIIKNYEVDILQSYLDDGIPTSITGIGYESSINSYLLGLKTQEQTLIDLNIRYDSIKEALDEMYKKITQKLIELEKGRNKFFKITYNDNLKTIQLKLIFDKEILKKLKKKYGTNKLEIQHKVIDYLSMTSQSIEDLLNYKKRLLEIEKINGVVDESLRERLIQEYNEIDKLIYNYESSKELKEITEMYKSISEHPEKSSNFYNKINDTTFINLKKFIEHFASINKKSKININNIKININKISIDDEYSDKTMRYLHNIFKYSIQKNEFKKILESYIKFLENQKEGKIVIIQKCIDILIRKVQNKIDEINGNYDSINDAFERLKTKQFGNNISINQDLITKDKQFFDKFKNGFPYSEYEFLYGIENYSLLEEEHKIAFGFVAKASFVSILNAIKAQTINLGTYLTLAVTGAVTGRYLVGEYLAFHLISRYIFDAYRRTKRMAGYKYVTFCTKYMPFEGMKCFKSSVVSLYHKMFFYDSLNMKTESNVKKFINKLIFGEEDSFNNKNDFEKRINTLKHYCGKYKNETKEINKESESRAKSYKFPEQLQPILDNISISNIIGNQSNEYVNSNPRLNENTKNNANPPFELDNNSKTSRVTIRGSNSENVIQLTKQSPVKPSPVKPPQKSWLSSFSRAKGGEKLDYLKSNVGAEKSITGEYRRGINIASTSTKDKLNFRLNYKIGETHLLTSGNISVLSLFNETVGIINSYANMIGGEAKVAWVKIPFFRNDYLLDKINDIFRTTWVNPGLDFNIIKEGILEYIFEYLDSFHKLYKLSEDNIINLMTKKDVNANNSLEDMFQHNLSYYGVPIPGAHKYVGKYKHGIGYRLEYDIDIKLRDKINYFCILMKYSSLAIDHMFKKFKINIVKFNLAKYNAYNEYEEKRNIGLLWGMFKSTPYMMWGSIPTYEEIDEFEGEKSTNGDNEGRTSEIFEFSNRNGSFSSLSENEENEEMITGNPKEISMIGYNENLDSNPNFLAERRKPKLGNFRRGSVHNGEIHNTRSNNSSSNLSSTKSTKPISPNLSLEKNSEKFNNYITYTDLEKGCKYKMYNNSKEYIKDIIFNKKSYGNTYVFNIGTYVIDYIKDFYFVKII